jgi:hypothetical protein
MKKIVPFNNVLEFSSDVCEITSISLEHEIKKEEDEVSGVFYISGEYKITEGMVETEPFKFDLPFDIALGANYKLDTLEVAVDDFRYELVDNKKLKVNIDLSVLGEEETPVLYEERVELPEEKEETLTTESDENINIFNGFNEEEKYVTYRVYPVTEGDSLDKIMEKYQVTKEDLEKYNDLSDVKPGVKLIIPSNDK